MVGMDGDRNGDAELVAEGVDDARHVPVIDRAVGFLAPFRLGDLDDERGVGPLGGLEGAADDKIVPSVAGHGNGMSLGDHGPVYHLAADDERLGIGEKLPDVGGTKLKGLFEIAGE